jgi:hypothetical protein
MAFDEWRSGLKLIDLAFSRMVSPGSGSPQMHMIASTKITQKYFDSFHTEPPIAVFVTIIDCPGSCGWMPGITPPPHAQLTFE